MSRFAGLSDDHYVNMNLNTEMDLPQTRDSVLHMFEQIQKHYPTMRNFYTRERGEHVLEEDKEKGHYRWATVEARRICSGHVNPESIEEALRQHSTVLEIAPFALSVSPLDCESLNVMFGFDYTYRGNHSQLLVEALGVIPAFERLVEMEGVTVIASDPALQLAFDSECRVQCRVSFETRTTAYHVRTGEFPEEQLSVYVTARRYGSLNPGEQFPQVMQRLANLCLKLIDEHVAEHILVPLQETIAIK